MEVTAVVLPEVMVVPTEPKGVRRIVMVVTLTAMLVTEAQVAAAGMVPAARAHFPMVALKAFGHLADGQRALELLEVAA